MSDAVTLKEGIVIYKDGFPHDFKETITAKLRRYWNIVNRSTLESCKIGEQLQEIHQATYEQFVNGPLYRFPERSDSHARAEYFRLCDEICDKPNKTPFDHVMTTHAGMAAISVLQTQDVGEYTLQHGGLSARDIIVRSRVFGYESTSRLTDGQHSLGESGDKTPRPATLPPPATSPRASSSTPSGGIAEPGDSSPLFTPREDEQDLPTAPQPDVVSPSFGYGGPEEYESILPKFSEAMQISSRPPPPAPLPPPAAAPTVPVQLAPSDVQPKYLALIGKRYRSKVFDLEEMRFTIADFAMSVVRGTKLYILRYENGERYVNEEGLGRILETSIFVEG